MNAAKYATFNIDALEFDYGGGGSSSQENQAMYHGPQNEGYDSSAAPQPTVTLGAYNSSSRGTSGLHETQQPAPPNQAAQPFLVGRVNEYAPRDATFLSPYAIGTPASAPAYTLHNASASSQYAAATSASNNPNPFDPLPISMNHHHVPVNPVNQGSSSNAFEDFLLNALVSQGSAPVDAVPVEPNATYSTVSSSPIEQFTEPWLNEIKITVSTLSLEPLSGIEIISRLQTRMDDVITKFLPCVDFLVQCQQDLRKGLALAQRKVGSSRRYFQQHLSPRQFWASYVEPLPKKFMLKNQHLMERKSLNEAVTGLERLRKDAKNSCDTSCEAVKNSFLGGMKEGESWGLRKWLSRHGNALAICTDMECILKALKTLDKSLESTKKLAELLRPLASKTLARLKKDVPSSYQERSSAHPYLPFFHRLESALRDVSQFDPDDDGVICLDDSDDDSDIVVEVKPPPKPKPVTQPSRQKRKAAQVVTEPVRPKEQTIDDSGSSSGSDEECDVVEIVGVKQPIPEIPLSPTPEWKCKICSELNSSSSPICTECGAENTNANAGLLRDIDQLFNGADGFPDEDMEELVPKEPPKKKTRKKRASPKAKKPEEIITSHVWPTPVSMDELQAVADVASRIAAKLDDLAQFFRDHREAEVRPMTAPRGHFWIGERYADVLSIFGSILRSPESVHFIENVSDDRLHDANPDQTRYTDVIKNPLCFSDIAAALIHEPWNEEFSSYSDGQLPGRTLASWNMWIGIDLLQALDLVLLNSLAYGKVIGEGRSRQRARTNELRKFLWSRIQEVVATHTGDDSEKKKQCTPTRRSETSGFVVLKRKD